MYFVIANEGTVSNLFSILEITNSVASGQAVLNTYGQVQSNKTYRPQGNAYQKNNLFLFNAPAMSDNFIQNAF